MEEEEKYSLSIKTNNYLYDLWIKDETGSKKLQDFARFFHLKFNSQSCLISHNNNNNNNIESNNNDF